MHTGCLYGCPSFGLRNGCILPAEQVGYILNCERFYILQVMISWLVRIVRILAMDSSKTDEQ